jgi:hypothetical protein
MVAFTREIRLSSYQKVLDAYLAKKQTGVAPPASLGRFDELQEADPAEIVSGAADAPTGLELYNDLERKILSFFEIEVIEELHRCARPQFGDAADQFINALKGVKEFMGQKDWWTPERPITIEELADTAVNANNEFSRTMARTLLLNLTAYSGEDVLLLNKNGWRFVGAAELHHDAKDEGAYGATAINSILEECK